MRLAASRINADALGARPFENDYAVNLCEESIVAAAADVATGVDSRTSLANKDAPASNKLPSEPLDPESLRVAVSPVASAAHSLFMSHRVIPSAV
jgi:hypothetical protein